ncbi:tannase/feruloyl esterase family alpha/beta hydrolase [Leptotrichia shahii]|uniref:tannase/feruloyl esterase family alpha/beta hydrolase n=1 Tax=Leptotrichia shahii TaxID=157691 RepID=UPI0028D6D5F1|nr:tannase/feruloyl esterase family alpha/beta hydrolase [Leptotrichia shahii]
MKKFKLIMISSLLMAAGITSFAAKTNNKKLEKKSVVFTGATKEKCMSLKNSKIYQTEITSAEWKEEEPLEEDANARFSGSSTSKASAPAHCVVKGKIEKRKGADGKDYSIGFELRLPEKWNNKFLFQGGGGLDGSVSPATGTARPSGSTAKPALTRGYAVVSTDSGHSGNNTDFVKDQQAVLNYAFQSTGKVTNVAKQLIEIMYSIQPRHSYFMGCSNGGREAMQAAMYYPNEFDGIIAGNPGFRLSKAAIGETWDNNQFLKYAPTDKNGNKIVADALTQEDLDAVAQGVLDRCDAKDGLKDGIVNNWEKCDFKPEMVEKKIGKKKVALLNAIFNGAKNSKGENVYASWPYDAGINTMGWRMWKHGTSKTGTPNSINFMMGTASLSDYYIKPARPGMKPTEFDFDKDVAKTNEIGGLNDADKTDLSTFKARGGKIIIYEGVSDPVFSAHDIRDWYKKLVENMGNVDSFTRLFMVPGMNHCGGGPAMENFDALTALEKWTEDGIAPDYIIGKAGKEYPDPNKEQPLCPYPKVATYVGGDKNKASSFECK